MRLKSLELHGFKSFADRTTFEFHPGVSGIVGPNGCGKSNVVDAIRWVLGETSAKALRGGEMADVIFNGTDKRKPVGMAEVTLTMADCEETLKVDYNELAVTRRVYRDGNSEYYLNGNRCRLRDIHELLMDTGIGQAAYSIMEQGKIDMLLSSKPEDRRAVFEEAAGVTKFKSQKREALRKLEYTEANLLRVVDVIREVERQKNSLQRQAQKARRYQLIHDDLRVLDTHLSHHQYALLQAEASELRTSMHSRAEEQQQVAGGIAELETKVGEARELLQQIDGALGTIRQQLGQDQSRAQAARDRIRFNEERARELTSLIESAAAEIEATRQRLGEEENALGNAEHSLEQARGALVGKREEVASAEQHSAQLRTERDRIQQSTRELSDETHRLESRLTKADARLASLEQQGAADRERAERLAAERTEFASKNQALTLQVEQARENLSGTAESLGGRESELHEAENTLRACQVKRDRAQDQLQQAQGELARKQSRLDVLRQLLLEGEGLEEGTQAVLKGLDNPELYQGTVRGLLASHLQVDPAFHKAIEAALGHHLHTILVADSAVAESILETLTETRRGRVTLLAEDLAPSPRNESLESVPKGAIAWALDKVKGPKSLHNLLHSLLARVLIVEDLATARSLRADMPEAHFATRRGEFVSATGLLTGGEGREGAGSMLEREEEVRRLERETGELATTVAGLQQQLEQAREQLEQQRREVGGAQQRLQQARSAVAQAEADSNRLQREHSQALARLENFDWEQTRIQQRLEQAAQQATELNRERGAALQALEDLRARTEQARQETEAAAMREAEAVGQLNQLRTALAVEQRHIEALEQQRHPLQRRLQELAARIEQRQHEADQHRQRIELGNEESTGLATQLEELQQAIEAANGQCRELEQQRESRGDQIRQLDQQLADQRRRAAQLQDAQGREEVQGAKLDLRIEHLTTHAQERYQVDIESFEPDFHTFLVALDAQLKQRAKLAKRRATLAAKEQGGEDGTSDDARATDGAPEASAPALPAEEDDNGLAFQLHDGEPDWDEVAAVVAEMRQRLDAMGPVNLDAIEEFEEQEQRLHFLETEHDDLVNSKEELLRVIQKINIDTRKKFAQTFEQVRQNFQRTFRELFGEGARANLVLTDEADPLESGIEIIAKPPGKKLQTISLLSGGERSLTAVAMLFSIYMVKPSPFCVLDELDAPLDEANIGRFLKMLDRFLDHSQFVIVTHNKRTMNRCDVMYGVTMEEFGISKPVGIRITGQGEVVDAETAEPAPEAVAEPAKKKTIAAIQ